MCDLISGGKKKLFSWNRWTEKWTPGRAVGTSQAGLSWDIVQQGLVPPLFKTWSDHQLVCGLQICFRLLEQRALQRTAPLTQTGLRKLFASSKAQIFPWANFAFAYISPAYVRVWGSSSQRRRQAHWPELREPLTAPGLSHSGRA